MSDSSRTSKVLKASFKASANSVQSRAMGSFVPETYAQDMHPAAIHAREWGSRKPYYIEAMKKEKAMKEAIKKKQEENK